jgi:hypothetical protein
LEVKTLNKKRLWVIASMGFLVAFLLLSSFSAVKATKPAPISFEEVIAGSPTIIMPSTPVGVNVRTVLQRAGSIEGDIAGTYVGVYRLIFHKVTSGPEKMTTGEVDFTITGTYGTKSGVIYLHLSYKIVVAEYLPDPPVCTGNWAIKGGEGDLTNMHGQGTFTIDYTQTPIARLFSGQVNFDP